MVLIKSRIRNLSTIRNTFCQLRSFGYIKKRLDFFFHSNSLQESLKKTDILVAFSTNHSVIVRILNMYVIRENSENYIRKKLTML